MGREEHRRADTTSGGCQPCSGERLPRYASNSATCANHTRTTSKPSQYLVLDEWPFTFRPSRIRRPVGHGRRHKGPRDESRWQGHELLKVGNRERSISKSGGRFYRQSHFLA